MGEAAKRRGRAGLTLIELLVVLGIIGVLSAVLIPMAVRNGFSSSSKTAFAAREVFTLLKAARVYASTHNIETALVYGGAIVRDSELALDSSAFPDPCVAIVDSTVLARRLTRAEMIKINEAYDPDPIDINARDIYVPVTTDDSEFRKIPKDMVLLTDFFAVNDVSVNGTPTPISATGLRGIQLFEPEDASFLEPRSDRCQGSANFGNTLDYAIDTLPLSFPAHIFLPDGSMRVPDSFLQQRVRFRVGPRPDLDYKDRFAASRDVEKLTPQIINVIFDQPEEPSWRYIADNATPADTTDDYYGETDVTLELFVPTGRVKMLP